MKASIILIFVYSLAAHATGMDLIYGVDNRHEANLYPSESFQQKAKSVAIRVSNRKLSTNVEDPTITDFFKLPLNKAMPNLCEDERFSNQYSLGDCSGFLIAKNRILTAGHCAFSNFDCQNNSWIFDFNQDSRNFKSSDVYKCKKIVSQSYQYKKTSVSDYAIIELERDTDREPLTYRKFGAPIIGTPLVIIGHPVGLPKKIADGANIKFLNDEELTKPLTSLLLRRDYFIANLDSYGGNSGSPVFNEKTGKVEGILIQGADDFSFDENKGCVTSNHLSNSHLNSYEKVLRINTIPDLK